jgi:RNA dependent RNA polymerase
MCVQDKCRLLVKDAVLLLGVMDEANAIPEGQVFFQWTPRLCDGSIGKAKRLDAGTRVAVSRNPCMGGADIRVLTAADAAQLPPALRALQNVIVFPQRGLQSTPGMMSGGDLDGDEFWAIWDPALVPQTQVAPVDYAPATLPPEVDGVCSVHTGLHIHVLLVPDDLLCRPAHDGLRIATSH